MLASLAALVAVSQSSEGLPYVSLPTLDLGIPIQPFGVIVAIGVLIGAEVMRRYALRHGVEEDDLRGLTGWVVVTGFLGAHVFDIVAYERDRWLGAPGIKADPLLILKVWDGISSYGGFIGGGLGFMFYLWWKRLTPGMWADATGVGLLLGFSIGRIGCTLVHDHIGRATTSSLGVDYPVNVLERHQLIGEIGRQHAVLDAAGNSVIRAHNMAMYELAYLIPVNALVLYLAFQKKRRLAAGFIGVLIGLSYAPVRFVLEYWRLNESDERYAGMTFAQYSSIVFFLIAGYAAWRLYQNGNPAPTTAELGGRAGGRYASLAALAKAQAAGAKTDDDAAAAKTDDDAAKPKPKKK